MTPFERTELAIGELERAVMDLLDGHPGGLSNAQIAKELGLFSPVGEPQRNQVTWWLLRKLVETGRVTKTNSPRPLYRKT
jgi:hypothetical protein